MSCLKLFRKKNFLIYNLSKNLSLLYNFVSSMYFLIKQRPLDNLLIVHFADDENLGKVFSIFFFLRQDSFLEVGGIYLHKTEVALLLMIVGIVFFNFKITES